MVIHIRGIGKMIGSMGPGLRYGLRGANMRDNIIKGRNMEKGFIFGKMEPYTPVNLRTASSTAEANTPGTTAAST